MKEFTEGEGVAFGLWASRLPLPLSSLEESLGGGEVVVLTGLDEEEVFDEVAVAADEAELAAELLTGAPHSPLPVREAAV